MKLEYFSFLKRVEQLEARADNSTKAGLLLTEAAELINEKLSCLCERVEDLEAMHACTNRQPFTWFECDDPDDPVDNTPSQESFPPCMSCDDNCMDCENAPECELLESMSFDVHTPEPCCSCKFLDRCLDENI